jgi:hypothetical protein
MLTDAGIKALKPKDKLYKVADRACHGDWHTGHKISQGKSPGAGDREQFPIGIRHLSLFVQSFSLMK